MHFQFPDDLVAPAPKTAAETHFVPFDTHGRRIARAYCGRMVNPDREHALEPTCARCAELQAQLDREAF